MGVDHGRPSIDIGIVAGPVVGVDACLLVGGQHQRQCVADDVKHVVAPAEIVDLVTGQGLVIDQGFGHAER